MNKSLCQQLANGLKDPGHGISVRSILNQQPDIQFASFRSDLANILGCRIRTVGAKGTLCNATMVPESPEIPVTEEESTIAAQLSMCIKDNQELHKKLDAFDPSKIIEVVTQAVAGGSLNPALSCKYCKDMGHIMSNCTKVKRKEALKAATASTGIG